MTKRRHTSNPAPEDAVFFTITQLAKRWKVDRHTVSTSIRKGDLQAFRIGERIIRVREDEVLRYEREHMPSAVAS